MYSTVYKLLAILQTREDTHTSLILYIYLVYLINRGGRGGRVAVYIYFISFGLWFGTACSVWIGYKTRQKRQNGSVFIVYTLLNTSFMGDFNSYI